MKVLILILLAGPFLPTPIGFGAHRSAQSPEDHGRSSGLQFWVDLDRRSYQLSGGTLRLRLSFKNVSGAPIALFTDMGWGPGSSLMLTITDEEGRGMTGEVLSDAHDYPPYDRKKFKTLEPGEQFRFARLIDLESEGVKKAGTYRLTVRYHCPVTKDALPEGIQNAWTADKGPLSCTVSFSVTE